MLAAETQYTEIGAFDAKTRLSESLRKVDQGERFRITVRGRAVADIVPIRGSDRERAAEAVRNLLAMTRIEGVPGETILEWIREGRE